MTISRSKDERVAQLLCEGRCNGPDAQWMRTPPSMWVLSKLDHGANYTDEWVRFMRKQKSRPHVLTRYERIEVPGILHATRSRAEVWRCVECGHERRWGLSAA